MNIIVSIHGHWFQKIKSGEKTVEVRKTVPKSYFWEEGKTKIYWYDVSQKLIRGTSLLTAVSFCSADRFYGERKHLLSEEEFKKYIGTDAGTWFWYLGKFYPCRFGLPEGKRPPQSWCYYNTIFGEKQ